MFILEIGPGPKPQAVTLWPKATIETVDVLAEFNPTYQADAGNLPEELRQGKYDAVFASHVLEHFPYFRSTQTLMHWAECVRPGGELHIIVPSFEWAAKQVLMEVTNPALMGHLHGGLVNQWDVHVASFTMRRLRGCMELAHLKVIKARSGKYPIAWGGEIYEAQQHYVVGVKPDGQKVQERQE